MHFTLFAIFSLFLSTTFVHSAPTASLDSTTLLNNALEAQKLNAQFRAANTTTTGSCTNGDTTCVQGAIASCVNGQFDTSKGRCPATQQCFALPSVNSNGTTIACTSEKSALSLIKAAGATGDATGSGSGSSINPTSASSTLSATPGTATSTDAIIPTSTATNETVVTETVTLIESSTTTLPSVTQTLSPEEASSLLSSLLSQGGPGTPTTSVGLNQPLETVTVSSTVTVTNIPTATGTPDSNSPSNEPSGVLSSTVPTSATNIPSSASPSPTTPVEIANTTGSPTSGSGGYSGY